MEAPPVTPQVEVPETVSPADKPGSKTPLIIAVVGLVFFLGITGFLVYQNFQLKQQFSSVQATPTSQPTAANNGTNTADLTERWMDYTDPVVGFTVAYPPEWKLIESRSEGYPYIGWLDTVAQKQSLEVTEIIQGAYIAIRISEYVSDLSLKEYYSSVEPSELEKEMLGIETKGTYTEFEVQMSGLEGLRRTRTSEKKKTDTLSFIYNGEPNRLLFSISLVIPDLSALQSGEKHNYQRIFETMLTTLTFN